MAGRSTLRASDADREHIAERLRQATAEGRLVADELEQRLGEAFKARTYGELARLVSDLPAPPSERRARHPAWWLRPAAVALLALVAAVVAAALIVTGIIFLIIWLAIGWALLGRHGGACRHRHVHHHVHRRVYGPGRAYYTRL
jgi:hypothetical protein